ncbi:unnamed protein product [Protopolystoma xenopodis]|uniref:Uncharacterized protein n=1 Tax=Protopolystoma xenopodis TaxID=117903 RepID=A0A448XMT0_9PLAT|nr:unnamed protein product [Protopolystoma xenopodis]
MAPTLSMVTSGSGILKNPSSLQMIASTAESSMLTGSSRCGGQLFNSFNLTTISSSGLTSDLMEVDEKSRTVPTEVSLAVNNVPNSILSRKLGNIVLNSTNDPSISASLYKSSEHHRHAQLSGNFHCNSGARLGVTNIESNVDSLKRPDN